MTQQTFKEIISSLPVDKNGMGRKSVQNAIVDSLHKAFEDANIEIDSYCKDTTGSNIESLHLSVHYAYPILEPAGLEVIIYRYGPNNTAVISSKPGYYYRVGFNQIKYSVSWAARKCTTASDIAKRARAFVDEECKGLPSWVDEGVVAKYRSMKNYANSHAIKIGYYKYGIVLSHKTGMTKDSIHDSFVILSIFKDILSMLEGIGVAYSFSKKGMTVTRDEDTRTYT